jgi:hypothetical protein
MQKNQYRPQSRPIAPRIPPRQRRIRLDWAAIVAVLCTAVAVGATVQFVRILQTNSPHSPAHGRITTSFGPTPTSHVSKPGALPGEQIWGNGVSSFLFGINDTYDWAGNNIENTPAAQQALKGAGFTLVRSFFSEQHIGWPLGHTLTTDADLELRFRAIESIGAQCLGVLAVSGDPQYDSSLQFLDHVLTYAETSKPGTTRCQIWEYGNEPYSNMSAAAYLQRWNHDIPILRAHHPNAKFVGLVDSGPYFDQIQAFLNGVKQSGVLPDAISYHDYPCYNSPDYIDTPADAQACDALITQGGSYLPSYSDRIRKVKQMIRATLGKDIPLGITEWNVSPNNVDMVNGHLPLTMSPTYQPHFIQEMYAAMAAAGLDFATEFDGMSGAGEGTAGSLDLIDGNNTPRPWIGTYQSTIASYRQGG